ncbi:MAG: hypothetical protein Q9M40_05905 [Sulfurimonas sp.]|nr:hypothetical protein [Sulfurimonas sp.]
MIVLRDVFAFISRSSTKSSARASESSLPSERAINSSLLQSSRPSRMSCSSFTSPFLSTPNASSSCCNYLH